MTNSDRKMDDEQAIRKTSHYGKSNDLKIRSRGALKIRRSDIPDDSSNSEIH